jgi:hypothetical protein
MNIKNELLKEHSKAQALKIQQYIGNDTLRFALLMDFFLGNTYRVTQRAAWVVSSCVEAHPELITPYLKAVIEQLKDSTHDAVKRNTLRLLQHIPIPIQLQGLATDRCFALIQGKEAIAIKVFAMTVLYNIVEVHPEMAGELKLIIEEQLPHSSAGFQSRGKKILRKLDKLATFD